MLVELLQAGESASRGMIEFTSRGEILDSHSNENTGINERVVYRLFNTETD